MKRLDVALLYNLKQDTLDREDQPWDKWFELDSIKDVEGYELALREGGHNVIPIEGGASLLGNLVKFKPDICFNTCEGYNGVSREAQVPALLDMLGIPYTGSGVMTLALALDKAMTKRILQYHNVTTPAFQVFYTGDEPLSSSLKFPLFAKPCWEGSGIGVSSKSICLDVQELRQQVKYVLNAYKQPVIVEDYVPGREITVGLVGNLSYSSVMHNHSRNDSLSRDSSRLWGESSLESKLLLHDDDDGKNQVETHAVNRTGENATITRVNDLCVFPPLEVDLSTAPLDQAHVYTSVIKGTMNGAPTYYCPTLLSSKQDSELRQLAIDSFNAMQCFDLARVDFRLREDDGKPFVLEINPIPGITKGVSDLVMAAETVGVDYASLINDILNAALKRYGMFGDG